MTTANLNRQVEKRLQAHSVRFTTGRSRLVAALARVDGPKSAAELHKTVRPPMPLSSLYRTLSVLEDAGVVVPHFAKKGTTRYELAEWLQGHHHHLVCVDCGEVEDIALTGHHERQVKTLVTDIGRATSFTPIDHTLEIEGRCQRCA